MRKLLLMNVFAAEELGARIKQGREEAGLTQEELADVLNVGTRMVQHYEAGSHKPYKHLKEIAQATGKPFDWFLREEDEASEDERLDTALAELGALRTQVDQILTLLESQREQPRSRTAKP